MLIMAVNVAMVTVITANIRNAREGDWLPACGATLAQLPVVVRLYPPTS
jgi:hypothetical protein